MNTPYQWTKQVASHFGGTRDGLVVHWPAGHRGRGEIRHQFHHVIDVLPTLLDAAGLPLPETVNGVAQQPVEGTSMRYCFDDADAEDRRRTQYFEMVGNRGIYHEGWTAVTRHGMPWQMVEEPRPFDDDMWELYDTRRRLVAGPRPRGRRTPSASRAAGALRRGGREAPGVPARRPGHRAGEPRARRAATTCTTAAPGWSSAGTGRLTEEAAPNVKNRSHRITVDLDIPADHPPQSTNGVLVAQGGRFGGWSLYVVAGRAHYAYNRYGKDLTVVAAEPVLWPGEHELVLDFRYDGGPPGSGGEAPLLLDGVSSAASGSRRPRRTTSPSTSPSTSASTAGARWSTTTRRCATGSPARSAGSWSTSARAPRSTRTRPRDAGQPAPATRRVSGAPSAGRPRWRSRPARGTRSGDTRGGGPQMLSTASSRPVRSRTGAETPQADGSNSPWQVAYPRSRVWSSSARSAARSVIVVSV